MDEVAVIHALQCKCDHSRKGASGIDDDPVASRERVASMPTDCTACVHNVVEVLGIYYVDDVADGNRRGEG